MVEKKLTLYMHRIEIDVFPYSYFFFLFFFLILKTPFENKLEHFPFLKRFGRLAENAPIIEKFGYLFEKNLQCKMIITDLEGLNTTVGFYFSRCFCHHKWILISEDKCVL